MQDITVESLYKNLMSDPMFTSDRSSLSKEDAAWDLAWQKYRQYKNNDKALSMGDEYTVEKALPIPPRPGLKWNPISHRWIDDKISLPQKQIAQQEFAVRKENTSVEYQTFMKYLKDNYGVQSDDDTVYKGYYSVEPNNTIQNQFDVWLKKVSVGLQFDPQSKRWIRPRDKSNKIPKVQ